MLLFRVLTCVADVVSQQPQNIVIPATIIQKTRLKQKKINYVTNYDYGKVKVRTA